MVFTIRKNSPTPSAVHIDSQLTNMSEAFLQDANNFIADKVFPNVPVQHQSDKYYTYPVGTFYRDSAELRAPGAEVAIGGYTVSTDTFFCDVYGFGHDITWQREANEDIPLDSLTDGTNLVTHAHLIRRERDFVDTSLQTGVWAQDVDLTGPTNWGDPSSDPIVDVQNETSAMLARSGFMPNTLVLSFDVYSALRNNPAIIERFDRGQTSGGVTIGSDRMAAIFDVDRVLVMKSVFNSAVEGQADSIGFTATQVALLCYVNPAPSIRMPSAGYTYNWSSYLRGNGLINIENYDIRDRKVRRIEGEMAFDHKVVSQELGTLFYNVLTP